MGIDSSDDVALARRAAAGDESAMLALYTRYADPLFAFVHHHLPESRADAEEVWQETWLAALRALPTYRGQSALFTWLAAIARRKVVDYRRRHGGVQAEVLSLVPADRLAELIDKGPLPQEVLLQQAARARVIEALGVLPEAYRRALVARYADGSSVEEVARLLGKSYKATESLLSRAREAFRTALAQVGEEELHER